MNKIKAARVKATLRAKRERGYGMSDEHIKFPFLTFDNDIYANFMRDIMEHLEVR